MSNAAAELLSDTIGAIPPVSPMGPRLVAENKAGGEIPADFDATRHATDGDGRPVFNLDQSLRKRPGRKRQGPAAAVADTANGGELDPPAATLDGADPLPGPNTQNRPPAAMDPAGARAAADNTAAVVFGIAPMLGPHWAPTPAERENITTALARVYEKHGSIDVPPMVGLVLAVSLYAYPRVQMSGGFSAIAARLTGRDAGEPGEPAAPFTEPGVFPGGGGQNHAAD